MSDPFVTMRNANYKKDSTLSQLRAQFFVSANRIGNAFTEEAKNMTRNCAGEFKTILILNMATSKYSAAYAELSPSYKKWKAKNASFEGFWKLWGSLMTSISLRETPKGYSVGVQKDVVPMRTSSWGSNKKLTPVFMYFWYGEKGRNAFSKNGMVVRNQPPRPVFQPTVDEYRIEFLDKRRKEAINKIHKVW